MNKQEKTNPNLIVKEITLEEGFREFSVGLDLTEFKAKQAEIKEAFYEELRATKTQDHFFRDGPTNTPTEPPGSKPTGQQPTAASIDENTKKSKKREKRSKQKIASSKETIVGNGARFYDAYRGSVSDLAGAQITILNIARSIVTDSVQSELEGRQKVQKDKDWQKKDSFVANYVKSQIAQGAKLSPEFAVNLFWKRVWQTTKWGPLFPFTAFINLYILPPKFFEWRARRKEQKQTSKALRKAAQTNRLIQSSVKDWKHIEKDQFKYIDVGDGKVLSIIKCKDEVKVILSVPPKRTETEDSPSDETPADTNGDADTPTEDVPTTAASPDPPGAKGAAALANAIVEAIDKIAGPPKSPRQKKLKAPPSGALRAKPKSP